MSDTLVADLTSAYMAAQRETDAKLGYSNPYALPIALAAIQRAADMASELTAQQLIDAAFNGRLRGAVIRQMKARGYAVKVR